MDPTDNPISWPTTGILRISLVMLAMCGGWSSATAFGQAPSAIPRTLQPAPMGTLTNPRALQYTQTSMVQYAEQDPTGQPASLLPALGAPAPAMMGQNTSGNWLRQLGITPISQLEATRGALALPPIGSAEANTELARELRSQDTARETFAREGRLPPVATLNDSPYVTRFYHTRATHFCYRPLYFEEINLERYGNTRGRLQPIASAAHFFGTIPTLPYQMALSHPNTCFDWQYPALAGRHSARVRELPPFSLRAGLVEAGAIVGLIAIIP